MTSAGPYAKYMHSFYRGVHACTLAQAVFFPDLLLVADMKKIQSWKQ